jgi:hypothetical protein
MFLAGAVDQHRTIRRERAVPRLAAVHERALEDPLLEHALELCQGVDSPPLFHAVSSALGYAYALSGRSAEAISLLEKAVDQARRVGVETGGCPHTAIREDASINLEAVARHGYSDVHRRSFRPPSLFDRME